MLLLVVGVLAYIFAGITAAIVVDITFKPGVSGSDTADPLLLGMTFVFWWIAAVFGLVWCIGWRLERRMARPAAKPVSRKVKFAPNQPLFTNDGRPGKVGSYGPDGLIRVDFAIEPFGCDWVQEDSLTAVDPEYFSCLMESYYELGYKVDVPYVITADGREEPLFSHRPQPKQPRPDRPLKARR